jgi:hypothetical protein
LREVAVIESRPILVEARPNAKQQYVKYIQVSKTLNEPRSESPANEGIAPNSASGQAIGCGAAK